MIYRNRTNIPRLGQGLMRLGKLWTVWLVRCSVTATSNRRLPADQQGREWLCGPSYPALGANIHIAAPHSTSLEVGSSTRQEQTKQERQNSDASGRDCKITRADNVP